MIEQFFAYINAMSNVPPLCSQLSYDHGIAASEFDPISRTGR
jgi:hypothetical protein